MCAYCLSAFIVYDLLSVFLEIRGILRRIDDQEQIVILN